jgi:hypothetical protein
LERPGRAGGGRAADADPPEDRNIGTAEIFDALGLPEYFTLEAFVKWKDQ